MRISMVTIGIVMLLCSGVGAGDRYDACRQEENKLRANEAESCSGFTKMVNPSGCIAAQKALKEYDTGKCRKVGEQEGVGIPTTNAKPAIKNDRVNVKVLPEPKETVAAPGQTEMEKLQAENSFLKSENTRLKAEIERLKRREK